MSFLIDSALECGFAACYLLPPEPFTEYKRRLDDGVLSPQESKLVWNVTEQYPWANAIVLLLWPYQPFADDIPVASNYIPANSAFHAVKQLMERVSADGRYQTERIHLPVRELLLRSGIGIGLKNGLTAIEPYGSRVAIQTLVTDARPEEYVRPKHERLFCSHCHLCEQACPSGAITGEGMDAKRCIRKYMATEPMPQWVMERMTALLGCDLCQMHCPYNRHLPRLDSMPTALSLERLLDNDMDECLELIGKNQKSGGRLIAQAMVMCANLGRRDLLGRIMPYLQDERELVSSAAIYAISRLQG